MYYIPHIQPYPNSPIYHYGAQPANRPLPNDQQLVNPYQHLYRYDRIQGIDQGGKPFVVNIEDATKRNRSFRTALWTGNHLQVTLMSIAVGDDIGLEIHPT